VNGRFPVPVPTPVPDSVKSKVPVPSYTLKPLKSVSVADVVGLLRTPEVSVPPEGTSMDPLNVGAIEIMGFELGSKSSSVVTIENVYVSAADDPLKTVAVPVVEPERSIVIEVSVPSDVLNSATGEEDIKNGVVVGEKLTASVIELAKPLTVASKIDRKTRDAIFNALFIDITPFSTLSVI
jgi:hypothetical protein